MRLQIRDSKGCHRGRRGVERDDWRGGKPLAHEGWGLSRWSGWGFIPPVMEGESPQSHAHSQALSCTTGVGNLGVYIPDLLLAVFQLKVHQFRILPDVEGRRKSKATITAPTVASKCVSFSRH